MVTDIYIKGIISFLYNNKCNDFWDKNWVKSTVVDKKHFTHIDNIMKREELISI